MTKHDMHADEFVPKQMAQKKSI